MPRRQRSPIRSLILFLVFAVIVMAAVWIWLSRLPLEAPSTLVSQRLPEAVIAGEDAQP